MWFLLYFLAEYLCSVFMVRYLKKKKKRYFEVSSRCKYSALGEFSKLKSDVEKVSCIKKL